MGCRETCRCTRPQTRSQVSKSKGKGASDLKDNKDAVAAQKSAQTVDPRGQVIEDTRDKVVVQDEPVDLDRKIQKEIDSTDPERFR